MNRRDLIGVLGSAVAWPVAALAQQPVPVIGYLSGQGPTGIEAEMVERFREGLGMAGFVEGRNVTIEYRWAEGQFDRLPKLAADLVGRKVDVIFAFTLTPTLAAQAATSTIPIVFNIGVDPAAFGLVKSWSQPGANITGVTAMFGPLDEKLVQLIHEMVPEAASLGFLFNPQNQGSASRAQHVATAAQVLCASAGASACW
jgi:putative tryptophan/tyrosine transport system substrate-binding protein